MQNRAQLEHSRSDASQNHLLEPAKGLGFIWLEITGWCNLECVHCYAESDPRRPLNDGMRFRDWTRALDSAAALGCRAVQFIGGEPTVHPDLPELIEHAREAGYEDVSVYTNGTHLTPRLKATFAENRVGLAFSIYGSSADVHDQVTKRRGSFARTKDAIEWAVASRLPVRVGVVDVGTNSDEVERTRKMLHQLGVKSVRVDRMRRIGRGAADRTPESPVDELCGRCGYDKVCVASNGAIYPCVFARFAAVGHVRDEEGLREAMTSTSMSRFQQQLAPKRRVLETVGSCIPKGDPGPCIPNEDDDQPRCMPLEPPKASTAAQDPNLCNPEEDPGPCNPEQDPGPCNPEQDPGPCNPEQDPGPCNPEQDPGPCGPDRGVCLPDE
jgi:MoaA/NifB/PqqE/SkfB family radical SAM enzyme